MKSFAVAVALAAAVLAPCASLGDAAAGIGGSVVDAATGRPLAGIVVEIAEQNGREPQTVVTDMHGFFVLFGLDPGRYVATARVAGAAASCRFEDVASGQMRRLQFVIRPSGDTACAAGRTPGSLIDPDETADVYRIR